MAILGGLEHGLPIIISEVFPNSAVGRCKKIYAGEDFFLDSLDSLWDLGLEAENFQLAHGKTGGRKFLFFQTLGDVILGVNGDSFTVSVRGRPQKTSEIFWPFLIPPSPMSEF